MFKNRREPATLRRASHSGSWYTNDADELNSQMNSWLAQTTPVEGQVRALIAPHAGYYYCGACGAHAYRQMDASRIKRVFILGPSHHVRLSGCALTSTEKYRTPFYDLIIDKKVNEELAASGPFETMSLDTDEDEHSIEMQLPYIAKMMETRRGNFTVVPVLVGSLSGEKEQLYGRVFSKYLADPENFFVISSDFCHWDSLRSCLIRVNFICKSTLSGEKERLYGRVTVFSKCLADPENFFVISSDFCYWGQRFNYTFYDKSCGDVWQSIEALDKMGMEKIEKLDTAGFSEYLKQYQNTICGRYPIVILLSTIDAMRKYSNGYRLSFKFLKYAQSSKCMHTRDSSVSYAAGVLTIN